MKTFFKFFWMAIKDALEPILFIIIFASPIIVGLSLGFALKYLVNTACGVCVFTLTVLLGYWLYYVIPHCITAMKYLKETNTDSFKEAWRETSSNEWF